MMEKMDEDMQQGACEGKQAACSLRKVMIGVKDVCGGEEESAGHTSASYDASG